MRRYARRSWRYARRVRRGRPLPNYAGAARRHLTRFRRTTTLAIATTGLLLALWTGVNETAAAQDSEVVDHAAQEAGGANTPAAAAEPAGTSEPARPPADPVTSVREATGTMHDLLGRAWGILPKLLIAAAILVLAAFVARVTRWLLRRTLRNWSRSSAFSALAGVVIYLLALGVALSVIVGDVRALVGSVGLTGLALSWALQTPIESFTGWLLNSFKGYYRIGDRIAVGDVFGDVYAIDFLTTTVWESGGPGKPVQGAQPTGALITFPNLEVLRNNIVNYTREFPQVWDEVTFGVANDSDLGYATRVIQQVAARIFGDRMQRAASDYRRILVGHGVDLEVSDEPQVYLALTDAWTNITVRYIVPARERRRWASELVLAVNAEIARPEHVGRIKPSYPRMQIEVLNAPGGDGIQQHTEDTSPSPQ